MHGSLMATSTPNKIVSLSIIMESISLQNEGGRGRRYKVEDGKVPTSPSSP